MVELWDQDSKDNETSAKHDHLIKTIVFEALQAVQELHEPAFLKMLLETLKTREAPWP